MAFHQRAFTLMEVLIAVTAISIVLAAITSVFFGALRLENKTHESMTRALPAQQALALLKRDLANLVVPSSNGLAGPLQLKTDTLNAQNGPEFYTTTGILSEEAPWPELQKVQYLLMESTNRFGGKDLVRCVTRNLLASSESDLTYQSLLPGVEQLAFQFYDGNVWQDSWDSTTAEVPMPKGIRVQIALYNTNRNQAALPPLELVVPILVQTRTNATQEATAP